MSFDDLEEIEAQLRELEYLVKKCRIRYEQFFMGAEKREPTDIRNQIKRVLKHSPLEKHRKAAIKFRYLNITQQFVTLSNYWDRVARMKEDGTFNYMSSRGFRPRVAQEAPAPAPEREEAERERVHRLDPEEVEREAVAMAAEAWRAEQPPSEATDAPGAGDEGTSLPDLAVPDDLDAVAREAAAALDAARAEPVSPVEAPRSTNSPAPRPVPRPVPQAPSSPPPAAVAPRPAAEAPVPAAAPPAKPVAPRHEAIEALPGARTLYDKYVAAKSSATKESEDLSFDQFESRLLKKRQTLREKFEQDFEFDVVDRDGKVSIVARKR